MRTFRLLQIDRHRLTVDGTGVTTLIGLAGCPLSCPFCINKDALKLRSRLCTPQDLLDKVMIDYCYFVATGGGVTFGGGEPFLQAEAIKEFISIKPKEMKVNIETSLNIPLAQTIFDQFIELVDEFIIDVKSLDDDFYKEYTGRDNFLVKKNLERIKSLGYEKKCRIRIPVIPEFKARDGKMLLQSRDEAMVYKSQIVEMGFTNVEIFDYIIRDYMK